MARVHVSLPLSGPQRAAGRELLRGAELAAERMPEVELVVADAFDTARAVQTARSAVDDPRALAYLGDFHSSQVLMTAPLLSAAGLLQVAPVATYVGLEGASLIRLSPHDGVGAQAIAGWLVDAGVRRLLVVHDHDDGYGVPVGAMCAAAARERGLEVRSRPIWDCDEAMDLDGVEALLYVGVAGSGAVGLWHDLHASDPEMWLLGSEGVAADWLAAELSAAEAARTRFFVAQRAPFGFYGYEAMALIGDAIAAGGGDRAATARFARSVRDRDSVLGRYSIDADGHTTSTAYGRLTVWEGELVWDR